MVSGGDYPERSKMVAKSRRRSLGKLSTLLRVRRARTSPSVVISNPVKLGAYDAMALAARSIPVWFIGPVVLTQPTLARWPSRRMNAKLTLLNQTRVFPGLKGIRRSTVFSSELFNRYGPRLLPMVAPDRRNYVTSRIFDLTTAIRLGHPETLIFTSGDGLYSARLAKARGAMVICNCRALHPQVEANWVAAHLGSQTDYRHPAHALTRAIAQEHDLADVLLCNSHLSAATYASQGVTADRLAVVHCGIDLATFAPKSMRTIDRLRVLYVGSLDQRKGVTYLLQAMSGLAQHVDFRAAGRGRPEYEQSLARSFPTGTFLGKVPHRDLVHQYHWADILVLPSLADAFGLVANEAMACGTPVVVTDRCGVSELIDRGKNGIVVPAGDACAIQRALEDLISDPLKIASMHRNLQKLRPYLGWERYQSELYSLYTTQLARRKN